jgi:hypothetical protein
MKRLVALVAVLLVAGSLFADNIDLGSFPTGKWLDPNYNAVWEFSAADGIRILDTSGTVLWSFKEMTVNDFKVGLDGIIPVLSYSCPEAGRSYQFAKKSITNADIVLTIARVGLPQYSVTMKKQ